MTGHKNNVWLQHAGVDDNERMIKRVISGVLALSHTVKLFIFDTLHLAMDRLTIWVEREQ